MHTVHPTSRRIISILYSRLIAAREKTCFEHWYAGWELVHGKLERKRTANRQAMARRYSIAPEEIELAELLFAIETYYVHLMKLSALAALSGSAGLGSAPSVERLDAGGFRTFLEELSREETFKRFGVDNYADGGLFGWFIEALDESELLLMQQETERILRWVSDSGRTGDVLRHAYHELVPNSARHATGAYYTPGWLAESILEGLEFKGNNADTVERRLLDPTCGSGTFLIAAISRSIQSGRLRDWSAARILKSVLANIVGFDIDPVAVLAAKTNYLIAVSELFRRGAATPGESIRIPVFLCDSLLVPEKPAVGDAADHPPRDEKFLFRLDGESFTLPGRLFRPSTWNRFVRELVECAGGSEIPGHPTIGKQAAVRHAESYGELPDGADSILAHLKSDGRVGRIRPLAERLRDLPEPLFNGRFDVLAGNPPWVNWEYLPPDYRRAVQPLWPRLGLFTPGKGTERAFSKEDISALVAYAACDRYLKDGGRLGFLMPQSLFKSSLNGRGFRRFKLGHRGPDLRVVRVDDLTAIRPFEGTVNRTAVVFIERGAATGFPVPYGKWSFSDRRKSVDASLDWQQVKQKVGIELLHAVPTDAQDRLSCWMTARAETVVLLTRLSGACPYRSRTGVFTGGANGIFYLDVLERRVDGNLVVRNVPERTKRRVRLCESAIEPDYVFPLLRGRDVELWKYAVSRAILCPHSAETGMHAVDQAVLQAEAPLTLSYLHTFREALLERKGFTGWERRYLEESFYACQRIGSYTFAPYKVVWRYISRGCRCWVVEPGRIGNGDTRPVIPHEKLMLLGFQDPDEAYYVCGVLSSTAVRFFVESRMVETQIGPHVISQLALPVFDRLNAVHLRIAAECRAGHASRIRENDMEAGKRMDAIDELTTSLLPITIEEIRTLQRVSSVMPWS